MCARAIAVLLPVREPSPAIRLHIEEGASCPRPRRQRPVLMALTAAAPGACAGGQRASRSPRNGCEPPASPPRSSGRGGFLGRARHLGARCWSRRGRSRRARAAGHGGGKALSRALGGRGAIGPYRITPRGPARRAYRRAAERTPRRAAAAGVRPRLGKGQIGAAHRSRAPGPARRAAATCNSAPARFTAPARGERLHAATPSRAGHTAPHRYARASRARDAEGYGPSSPQKRASPAMPAAAGRLQVYPAIGGQRPPGDGSRRNGR